MRNASRMETRRRARRGVSPFWSWWEVPARRLGRGEEVVRRGAEVGWDARCCVKVATRRLLKVQLVVVPVLGSGKKSDAVWHVPQLLCGTPDTMITSLLQQPSTIACCDRFDRHSVNMFHRHSVNIFDRHSVNMFDRHSVALSQPWIANLF